METDKESTLFFGINDKILKSKNSVQQKKFYKKARLKKILKKLFLTFPSMYFPILKRNSLRKVWIFVFHQSNLIMPTILVHFELFYRDTCNLEILSNEDLDFLKTKTKETALLSFRQYNKNPQQNLSKEELAALTNLSKNKDIVIQKSDKGNSVVIVDKDTYIKRMENLLSDQRKLKKLL